MTTITKTENSKCWQECREIESFVYCWWECKMVSPLWKTVWWFLKKLKIELSYDPAFHSWVYAQENWRQNLKRYICTPMFKAALFTIVKCPMTDERINKMWYIHTMEYYSAWKRKEILTLSRMNHEKIMLSEIRQSQKDKHYVIPLI